MALPRKITLAKIYDIKAHNGHVTSLDIGETGPVLVTGGQDRNINLWTSTNTETCFMSLTGHNRPIDCVRFAYEDNIVYSADDIGIIRRWDLNSQATSTTFNGHMKSVRTLDFYPWKETVVSGSNDTTVRLWDVHDRNRCLKVYRGHIGYVKSVKFSPDGIWIASAGTEGSVIIWDIRGNIPVMDFTENPPADAVTCVQFHPNDFLLAVGRVDGTIWIYDLEKRICILKTNETSKFYGYPIQCITFSENGECLFVGTTAGLNVIGWEPEREFDYIKTSWTKLGDMKLVNKKLYCGSYEHEYVSISCISVDRIFPFYNPSNGPAFSHNSTTRKSFSRGNQKLHLSIVHGPKPSRLVEENEDNRSPSLDGKLSSPILNIELVDEVNSINVGGPGCINSNLNFNTFYNPSNESMHEVCRNVREAPIASSNAYSSLAEFSYEGPSSLKMPGERDLYRLDHFVNHQANEFQFNMNDSNPPIISNYEHTEMVEDFPVNTNNQQQQPTSTTGIGNAAVQQNNIQKTSKPKPSSNIQKRSSQIGVASSGKTTSTTNLQSRNKLSQISSVSTTELHKMDDNMLLKKSTSSHIVNKGAKRAIDSQSNLNKENARHKNFTVQFITKPITRSKTSLELRSPQKQQQLAAAAAQRQSNRVSSYTSDIDTTNIPISYRPDPSLLTQPGLKSFNRNNIDDTSEIHMLSSSHEQVYQELSNRHAVLQLIRSSTRSHDIVGALKEAIKINGRAVFVDLLGAILEKTSSWNLDLCLILLPEIYQLLQSENKFHYTRACDTLRVILSNFLPIIQDNIDPWAASGLGVDVSREERQRKCIECQHWLLQIRNIPESNHLGTTLLQLQNMIVNL